MPEENLIPFKRGVSGNSKGRPRGALGVSTIIRKWMATKDTVKNPLTGEMTRLTSLDKMVISQMAKAFKGDTAAFKELMDRMEGKSIARPEADVKSKSINVDITPEQRDKILNTFKNDY